MCSNKHFQNSLHISKAESGFVQFANFIGYFVMAIPSGLLAKRFGYKGGRRLVLLCDDVDSSQEAQSRERTMPGSRCVAPTRAMVKKALAFAKALPDDARLLVHCGHGISRSTALAFAILCQAQPDLTEEKVYQKMLRLRPQAFPNALIVAYADALLNRNGRMSQAIPSGRAKFEGRSQK
jgi:predicted protein tyrosine phosphatase